MKVTGVAENGIKLVVKCEAYKVGMVIKTLKSNGYKDIKVAK